MTQLNIGTFSVNTPMRLAADRGLFADAGLDVQFHQVASSQEQFRDLANERYHLVLTAFDNVLNYSLNESNVMARTMDLKVVRAVDWGMHLSLVGQAAITQPADLRGGTLAVDAPDSGFAYLAYDVLARAGLHAGSDYDIVRHGGVRERFEHMVAGEADATLLSNGFEILASTKGMNIVAGPEELRRPYLGAVFAGLRPWLEVEAMAVAAFLEAYDRAVGAVFAGHQDGFLLAGLVAARGVGITTARALLYSERDMFGLVSDGVFDDDAARGVALLRAEQGGFDRPVDVGAVVSGLKPHAVTTDEVGADEC